MRSVAVTLARLRVAAGLVEMVAPRLWTRALLDSTQRGPAASTVVRLKGGRDVALGIGTLMAARHDGSVRGWMEAAALTDLLDAVVLAADPERVVAAWLRGVGAATGVGVAVVTALVARRVDGPPTRARASGPDVPVPRGGRDPRRPPPG